MESSKSFKFWSFIRQQIAWFVILVLALRLYGLWVDSRWYARIETDWSKKSKTVIENVSRLVMINYDNEKFLFYSDQDTRSFVKSILHETLIDKDATYLNLRPEARKAFEDYLVHMCRAHIDTFLEIKKLISEPPPERRPK